MQNSEVGFSFARLVAAGPGVASLGMAGPGAAWQVLAWLGGAGRGLARIGKARIFLGVVRMLYVIRAGGSGHYKIGFTSKEDVYCRVKQLQTGNPLKLSVVLTIDGDESDEAFWHMTFAHRMTEAMNEWFELTDNDLRILENGKNTEFQSSSFRDSPFDVRPVCGRQQYATSTRGEDVPRRKSAFDSPQHQPVFVVGGRKHFQRNEDVLRLEAVANDCDGHQGVHDDYAV